MTTRAESAKRVERWRDSGLTAKEVAAETRRESFINLNLLTDDDRYLLDAMLEWLKRSFMLARAERRRLHDEEWSVDGEIGFVLGEAEVLAGLVVGVGVTWLLAWLDH